MKNFSAYCCRMVLVCSALSTIFVSIALAAEPRPPSCLSTDGSPPEPGATCCDSTPTQYTDENGPPGNGTVIGELLPRSDTFYSIGFVWDIDGDSDHDGSVSVRYRKAGACNFAPAMPLVRNDYAWFWHDNQAEEPANNLAGSLMFLTPGTTYEVVLELSDPDGGRAIRVRELTTRAIPRKPTSGRTLYVIPGNGGGDGSSANPFRGIAAANAAANPGDTFLLRDGTYAGTALLDSSGAENNYIVYEPDTGASPVIESLEVTGSYIWMDQLTFVRNANDQAFYVPWASTPHDAHDNIVTNSNFSGYFAAIRTFYTTSYQTGGRWTIINNTIVGDKAAGIGTNGPVDGSGWGVHAGKAGGHVIAYNRISRVGDGIGSGENSDVYGNDVFDVGDDNITTDASLANVRVWANRMHTPAAYNISFQPQNVGPWYFLYNQMAQAGYGPMKWRVQDRIVFINNTIVGNIGRSQPFMKTITRNNLFIGGAPIWAGNDGSTEKPTTQSPPQWLPSWNTDVDYDGFDWGADSNRAFAWFDMTEYYPDLPSFVAAVNVEQNGIRVDRNLIFEDYVVSRDHSLTLNPSGNAVDAGAYLPNLADFYEGAAPDLGAHEVGAVPLHFGPRSGTVLHEHELRWAKH